MSVASGSSHSRGVAILINTFTLQVFIKETRDDSGRILVMLAEIQGLLVVLVNAYTPNIDDPSFFGLLEHKVSEMGNYPVIMGRDFNQVWDPVLHRQPSTPLPRRSVNVLKDMCEGLGLVDIWHLHSPTSREYTFFSLPHGSLSRIDYFFYFQLHCFFFLPTA